LAQSSSGWRADVLDARRAVVAGVPDTAVWPACPPAVTGTLDGTAPGAFVGATPGADVGRLIVPVVATVFVGSVLGSGRSGRVLPGAAVTVADAVGDEVGAAGLTKPAWID
jgi:hypothetical protein